jgi:hypothetical protein
LKPLSRSPRRPRAAALWQSRRGSGGPIRSCRPRRRRRSRRRAYAARRQPRGLRAKR